MPELLPGIHTIDGITMELVGAELPVHPVLIEDGGRLTLVDTGPVGSEGLIKEYIEKMGYGLADIERIIVTHHHSDHTGALARLAADSGAIIAAHADEAPFLEGRVSAPARPMSAEGLHTLGIPIDKSHYEMEREWEANFTPPAVKVVDILQGGDTLPILDGLMVLHDPGHSPGHIALYAPARSLLLAVDLFHFNGREIHIPLPVFTQDAGRSLETLRSIVETCAFNVAIPYHGLPIMADAAEKLRRAVAGIHTTQVGHPLPGQVLAGS